MAGCAFAIWLRCRSSCLIRFERADLIEHRHQCFDQDTWNAVDDFVQAPRDTGCAGG